MKKNFWLAGIIAIATLSLTSFISCSSEAGPQGGTPSAIKASIDNIEVFASYNGNEKGFRGKVSGSSITIDLPANIDSWTDSWIRIYLDYGKSIQLNGTGTTYSGSSSEKITGVTLSSLNSILVKGSGYEDQSYTVKINKKLYVSYNKNYTGAVTNWTSVVPSSTVLYSAGDKISLPAEEAQRSKYRQLGWSSSTDAESPEYDVSGEIAVTESMVNAGVLDLYVTWSKYCIGQLLENVTDVDGKTQTGYVAYVCGKNDSVKAKSSKPSESWTYLIVSKYGENRLTDVNWSNATFTGAYLPTKTEMETIITNLWEDSSSRQWKIFSDGSNTSSNWDYYWTATVDDADSSKAYYASVTTNYNGSYAGNVVSTKSKGDSLKAIGVSHIE